MFKKEFIASFEMFFFKIHINININIKPSNMPQPQTIPFFEEYLLMSASLSNQGYLLKFSK